MSHPFDMNSDPTVVIPRVEPDPEPEPEPTPEAPASSGSRGKIVAVGASVAALVLGAAAGWFAGSSGSSSEAATVPVAATTVAPPTTSAPPAPGPGMFLAASGTVDTIAGDTFVLKAEDGTKITIGTTAATRIVTLQGDEFEDLEIGDAAVVQGEQSGGNFVADLVIAGALSGLLPTTEAAAPTNAVQQQTMDQVPQPTWRATAAPTATQVPESAPMDGSGPSGGYGPTGQYGPDGDYGPSGNYGPDGDYGPSGNYGPDGDYGPSGNYGPRGDYGPRGGYGPDGGYGPR